LLQGTELHKTRYFYRFLVGRLSSRKLTGAIGYLLLVLVLLGRLLFQK